MVFADAETPIKPPDRLTAVGFDELDL